METLIRRGIQLRLTWVQVRRLGLYGLNSCIKLNSKRKSISPGNTIITLQNDPCYVEEDNQKTNTHIGGSRLGDRGSRPTHSPPHPPLKNLKNIGFLSTTGQDILKITKLPSQYSILGHHQHARKTSFKWCFAGGLTMANL